MPESKCDGSETMDKIIVQNSKMSRAISQICSNSQGMNDLDHSEQAKKKKKAVDKKFGEESKSNNLSENISSSPGSIIFNYNIDPYDYEDKELMAAGIEMFRHYNLFKIFSFDESSLLRFMMEVSSLYNPENLFHNFKHVWGVMHIAFQIMIHGGENYLQPLDIFAVMISAMCHDLRHPGNNNAFEMATQSELSKIYALPSNNEPSCVLERHHASLAQQLLDTDESSDHDILKGLTKEQKASFYRQVGLIILGTDMAKHQMLLQEARLYSTQRLTRQTLHMTSLGSGSSSNHSHDNNHSNNNNCNNNGSICSDNSPRRRSKTTSAMDNDITTASSSRDSSHDVSGNNNNNGKTRAKRGQKLPPHSSTSTTASLLQRSSSNSRSNSNDDITSIKGSIEGVIPTSSHSTAPNSPAVSINGSNSNSSSSSSYNNNNGVAAISLSLSYAEAMPVLKGTVNRDDAESRLAFTRVIVHTADIGAQTQCQRVAVNWMRRCYGEFRSQANKEKTLGIMTSPFLHDLQEDYKTYAAQYQFIEDIIAPIWTAIRDFLPGLKFALNQLDENKQHYKAMLNDYYLSQK